ncbi:4-hydroxythreonine-4-phosphate dehydrogenase PdxA [Rhodobacteraceae bacterium RKSG542]|uniref:4-hydroxythreonine-4-phosphate dehydrogenase PdxA n=1 Tax=Pseudovibrio flavus TaxID=2529854 RepID=UPI0012BBEA02|nr:4-hydroxythreonine-4-phosphate dehydrogenase PdxA [Pseudovibrio flavus]MTI17724.1 4-hydroxythreonine-4-phosphate dehydrogenase PdxA [Pseudovibrio flavus]
MKPRIGIIPGDPSGIGPELIARLLNDNGVAEAADILLIGDAHVFEEGQKVAGLTFEMNAVDASCDDWKQASQFALHAMETITLEEIVVSSVEQPCGASVLKTLDQALKFLQGGVIDALVFGPFNKASMHLAGLGHDDELHYMAEKLGVSNYISELNTLDGIWTSRVTSHIALRDVADAITEERIEEAVHLIDRTLRRSGLTRPRISVAAINPHAGDGGNFGTEEIDTIEPIVRRLAETQMSVDGPWPSDTVFLKAVAKEIDAVVTMYHDQGQIALKLLGFDRGVTVQGGLPYPVSTPAHGTAFDIAGKGLADVGATRAAFDVACDMVQNWDKAELTQAETEGAG